MKILLLGYVFGVGREGSYIREDHFEALEKMFPKGFMIVYIKPNDEPQIMWHNPLNDPVFHHLEGLVEDALGEDYDFN